MRNFPPGKSQRAPIIVEPCSGGGPAKSQSDCVPISDPSAPPAKLDKPVRPSPGHGSERPDCVAGHVRLEVRRETGKE